MADLTGHSLGRYHILEPLGKGGMAEVYKAFDPRLQRVVAIKVIRPGQEQSESFLQRFIREAQAHARLSHAHILKIMDFGEEGGSPYLVMEYVSGGTLAQRTGKPLPFQEAARLLASIARALEYAHHEHKLVHRDVKPSNILLTAHGAPLLSDFGIVKMMQDEETREQTGTGVGIGTAAYMAPEQGTNADVDHRADIYALGVVFYELVTGHKPFEGVSDLSIMLKKATEPVPRPSKFVPGLPGYVEEVLLKALARNPEQRYQDMGQFAFDLERLAGGGIPAVPGVPGERPGFPLAARWRGPAAWVVMGVLGVLGIALAGLAVRAASSLYRSGFAAPTATASSIPSPTERGQDQAPPDTPTLARPSPPPSPTLSDPDVPTGKIVFTCQKFKTDKRDQICLMNADGSNYRRLTLNDGGDYNYPTFSPDGQSILYSGNEGGGFGIYEMDLDGQLIRTIPCPTSGECYEPDVSPDDQRLVVTSLNNSGVQSVWVMDRFGGNESQLASNGGSPVWSPDGQQVLYATHPQRTALFIINSDGTNSTKIADLDGSRGRGDWSVNNLIATAAGSIWHYEIYTLTPAGSTPTQVGKTGGSSQGPAFSPDGRWLVYMSYLDNYGDGNGCEIYIMWTDGSHPRRLTTNDYCDWQPRWGP